MITEQKGKAMSVDIKSDSALERFVRDCDPDDLIAKADASTDATGCFTYDFKNGIRIGLLAASGSPVWGLVTEDRNVTVYFVGSYDVVLRRICAIKQKPKPEPSEIELTGLSSDIEEL